MSDRVGVTIEDVRFLRDFADRLETFLQVNGGAVSEAAEMTRMAEHVPEGKQCTVPVPSRCPKRAWALGLCNTHYQTMNYLIRVGAVTKLWMIQHGKIPFPKGQGKMDRYPQAPEPDGRDGSYKSAVTAWFLGDTEWLARRGIHLDENGCVLRPFLERVAAAVPDETPLESPAPQL